MSKINTADKRDEIRRESHKPWYVKCPWFEKEFPKALNEIDRLSMLVDYAKESGITINPQDIEQRTKDDCKQIIKDKWWPHDYGYKLESILQAIEGVSL